MAMERKKKKLIVLIISWSFILFLVLYVVYLIGDLSCKSKPPLETIEQKRKGVIIYISYYTPLFRDTFINRIDVKLLNSKVTKSFSLGSFNNDYNYRTGDTVNVVINLGIYKFLNTTDTLINNQYINCKL